MKGGNIMASEEKVICNAKVYTSEMYTRKDGTYGYKCVAICDDGKVIQMYRPGEEDVKKDDLYELVLGTDNSLKPVVRMRKK